MAADDLVPDEQGPDLGLVAADLAAAVEKVFAELDDLAAGLRAVVEGCVAAGRTPVVADLAPLRPLGDAALDGDVLLVGAGVVLAPGLLADADRYLEWRQRGADGRYRPLVLDVDPAGEDPYDYPEMEWFRVPRVEGRRMVGGPYFDYRGADRFALTFARPVVAGDLFAGVAGADVPLASLEADLLPVLRRVPARAALVNHENRVVTANTPHYATGSRVRPGDGGVPLDVVPVLADLGWSLLVTR